MAKWDAGDADGTPPALYKIVGPSGECLNGGAGRWPLPHDGEPGEWREVSGRLEACHNGLHLTDRATVGHWSPTHGEPYVVYRVETDGELFNAGEKWVARKVRLLPRPPVRPAPDLDAIASRHYVERLAAKAPFAAELDKAASAYNRAIDRAERARDAIVPSGLAGYVAALGSTRGLPKVGSMERIAEAQAAYDAVARPATRRLNAVNERTRAAQEAVITPILARQAAELQAAREAVMPD